jgi:hypothetical protein
MPAELNAVGPREKDRDLRRNAGQRRACAVSGPPEPLLRVGSRDLTRRYVQSRRP